MHTVKFSSVISSNVYTLQNTAAGSHSRYCYSPADVPVSGINSDWRCYMPFVVPERRKRVAETTREAVRPRRGERRGMKGERAREIGHANKPTNTHQAVYRTLRNQGYVRVVR